MNRYEMKNKLEVNVISDVEIVASTDIEKIIFDLDSEIELMSSHADKLDCYIAAASGLLCGMLDILWVGDFSLERGRNIAEDKINSFVEKTAKLLGCKEKGIKPAVAFLEKKFPIPSDGNTPDFGGGLQHHLRDFAHHPTIVGLMFSLLTQFTEKSYGTDVNGNFKIVPVPEKSQIFIGKNVPDKIIKGTMVWFFHLISDIAGSSSTAGRSGGTGIPGPLLSLAKEISALPLFKNIKVGDNSISVFLSKLFNGTLLAKHDKNGNIIKGTEIQFDLRGELGVAIELSRQAIPVVANESIVRLFYFIRRLCSEIKLSEISSISDIITLDWDKIKPSNNPTITRMITIATGVFTTVDIAEAIATKKYFVAVNYVGIGKFAISISNEMTHFLQVRDVKIIKAMYEDIQRNTYTQSDNNIYKRMGEVMDIGKFGLSLEQTEILYNLEMYKTINDINSTSSQNKIDLKSSWLKEWMNYMESGFANFVGSENAELHWYTTNEIQQRVANNKPEKPWFRLMLLEAMLFEPYFPLSLEKDKNGKDIPCEKYSKLSYDESDGDKYLNTFFKSNYYEKDYIKRLRKSYEKSMSELSEMIKTRLTKLAISATVTIILTLTAGMFAPAIAIALVGSNFAGLSGAALTSACLAYLGGGAVAAGGLGMAGGTMAIVGGGAVLGIGVGAGAAGTVGAVSFIEKKQTMLQSAKLMVSLKEIFLNDEKDIEYSNSVYEQYVNSIKEIEHELIEMRYSTDKFTENEMETRKKQIKNGEESVKIMQIAMKEMKRFNSSFEEGLSNISLI